MADDNEESEPAVELGPGSPVDGAPVARVASRLSWPQRKSNVIRKEGETVIRTPDGPQRLADVLEAVDTTNFVRRQAFVDAVQGIVGTGPIPTSE